MSTSFEFGNNFYNESSVLNVADIVRHKKEKGIYNFTKLPEVAILTLSKNVLNAGQRLLSKKTKGLAGINYIVNQKYLLCTGFGNGAPAIVTLMEELKELGVSKFVFIGFAGSIMEEIAEGDVFFVQEAFSLTGSSMFYSSNKSFVRANRSFSDNIISSLHLRSCKCASTDAPYRETKSLLLHLKNEGVTLVDMEIAAVYAFAQYYKLEALGLLISADRFSESGWSMPENQNMLNKQLRKTISAILAL